MVELPKTKDCNAQGAVCTAAGAKLSTRLELRVGGPRGQGQRERVYTFEDGDRTVRVILQGDLVVSETGAGTATDEVARRAARGNIVRRQFGTARCRPAGVSLCIGRRVDDPAGRRAARAGPGVGRGRGQWLLRAEQHLERTNIRAGLHTRTGSWCEPNRVFPSLELANALAAQKGVVVSSPNWWREVGTRQNPEEPEGVRPRGRSGGQGHRTPQ